MRCIVPLSPRRWRLTRCQRCRCSPTAKDVSAGSGRGVPLDPHHRRRETVSGRARGGETLPLPARLPEGYHTLTLTQDGDRWHCRAIVAPARCYEPQALKDGQKLWGTCVQLYTLRSEKNWGLATSAIYARCYRKSPAGAARLSDLTRFTPSIRLTQRAPVRTALFAPLAQRYLY